ncbi:MAG: hydantoinase/oxoprolinase family protein [Gammaproteobacteria bacterium]|nr:hydantoinase/oxoprolinase family protein [Gammaproteobacteria bacterium]
MSSKPDASIPTETAGRYRIGIDTGGTFTDVVVGDATGILSVGKALTTRERISRGILDGLAVAAAPLGLDVRGLLGRTSVFIYGSTRATNAIIEGKTARTALLVTQGFPDTLVRREGGKTNPWDYSQDYPEPYIPRHLTFEIPERMTAEGSVFVPLDEAAARAVIERLRELRVEAVAVCLLWSIANPEHELALGRLLERELAGIPFSLSHEVNPIVREYRRASSAAIDASLKPLMQRHLREMEADLEAAGLAGELLPAVSLGGVMHIEGVIARPIHMVRSGPSLAPVLGQVIGAAEVGATEVIVCDTGGTSFDVSLVRNGRPVFGRDTWLGPRYTGHLSGLSSVDARSIGSGGGSIASIDSGGLLRVGPESAGADPGPACYGRGGTRPTVTDAALVLGYLDAAYFNGGRMPLDAPAAHAAVQGLAASLGKSVHDTAAGILTVASEHMVAAIKEITINEGVDPRDSLLLAGGGAAGLNIVPIARELGCRRVLLPRMAGALSACGAQYTDIVTEFGASQVAQSKSFDYQAVNRTLDGLRLSIEAFTDTLRARGVERFRSEYFVEARYLYQVWELDVPLPGPGLAGPAELDALVRAFHAVHESIFAVCETDQEVEFIQWKGRITGELDRPALQPVAPPTRAKPSPARSAPGYFPSAGIVSMPMFRGETLGPGDRIAGPALIVEPITTLVLYPGSAATVTSYDNYMVEVS